MDQFQKGTITLMRTEGNVSVFEPRRYQSECAVGRCSSESNILLEPRGAAVVRWTNPKPYPTLNEATIYVSPMQFEQDSALSAAVSAN